VIVIPYLAAAAGALGVLGAWDAVAELERMRVAGVVARALEPVVRAGREGREPTAPERRRVALVAAGTLAAAGWLVGGVGLGALAAVTGPGAALALVRARRRRYAREVQRGAAGVARALADAVGAGHSVRGALAEAARDAAGPAGRELRAARRALALGEPTAAVLLRLRVRASCPAWDTLVAGVLLQRDAGGDLAGLLRELAASLELTERVERDARAATAQARFTARVVLALPLGAAGLAELASPGFLTGLLADPLSAWLVAVAALLQAAAMLAVRRLGRPRGAA
jgi:tight adherence protein B